MRSSELKTKDLSHSRGAWKIKLLLVFILLIFCGAVAGGLYLYEHLNQQKAQQDFVLAQALIEKERFDEAAGILIRLFQDYPRLENRESVIYDLALSTQESSSLAESLPFWKALVEEFPNSTYTAKAYVALAKISEASGDYGKSRALWDKVRTEFPNSDGAVFAELARAQELEQAGNIEEARQLYYQIIQRGDPKSPVTGKAMDELGKINTDLLFTPKPSEWKEMARIQRGDSLIKLAYKYHTTANFIAVSNEMDISDSLIPGRRLFVPTIESFKIRVDKSELCLYLYTGAGKFIKRYPAGIGKHDYLTPPGHYLIWHKLKQPPWYDRENARKVLPDDPEYPLGTRWMTLAAADDPSAFSRLGIHGTNEPETVGQRESDGCIRLHNKDVEELFVLVPKGTPVEIVQGGEQTDKAVESSELEPNSPLLDWVDPEIKGESD